MRVSPTQELIQFYPFLQPQEPVFLASGLHNHCFKTRDRILRWRISGAAGRSLWGTLNFEVEIHHFLADKLLTAALLEGPTRGEPILTLEFLDGTHLDVTETHQMEAVGRLYSSLHALNVEALGPLCRRRGVGDYLDEIEGYLDFLDRPVQLGHLCDWVSRLRDQLIFSGPCQTLIHGDGGYTNFRLSQNGAAFIDWEWAEVSHPQLDLGHFFSPLVVERRQGCRLRPECVAAFWMGYHGKASEPRWSPTVDEARVLVELRALAWLAHRRIAVEGRDLADPKLSPQYWGKLRDYRLATPRTPEARGLPVQEEEPNAP